MFLPIFYKETCILLSNVSTDTYVVYGSYVIVYFSVETYVVVYFLQGNLCCLKSPWKPMSSRDPMLLSNVSTKTNVIYGNLCCCPISLRKCMFLSTSSKETYVVV